MDQGGIEPHRHPIATCYISLKIDPKSTTVATPIRWGSTPKWSMFWATAPQTPYSHFVHNEQLRHAWQLAFVIILKIIISRSITVSLCFFVGKRLRLCDCLRLSNLWSPLPGWPDCPGEKSISSSWSAACQSMEKRPGSRCSLVAQSGTIWHKWHKWLSSITGTSDVQQWTMDSISSALEEKLLVHQGCEEGCLGWTRRTRPLFHNSSRRCGRRQK